MLVMGGPSFYFNTNCKNFDPDNELKVDLQKTLLKYNILAIFVGHSHPGFAPKIWEDSDGKVIKTVEVGTGECTGKSNSSLSLTGHFNAFGKSGPADIAITFTSDSTADVLIKAINNDTQKANMAEKGGKLHYMITTLEDLEVIQSKIGGGMFRSPGVIFEIPSRSSTWIKFAF